MFTACYAGTGKNATLPQAPFDFFRNFVNMIHF